MGILTGVLFALPVLSGVALAESKVAEAKVAASAGAATAGTVKFTQIKDGVRVTVHLKGLSPGEHGFHIHETGDCSAADFTSAGPHYNPLGASHGARHDAKSHMGDLGNLTADAKGDVTTEFIDPSLTLIGEHSIVGRAVIVHAGKDDLTSQPAGNSGPRVGCGVIAQSR